MGQRTVVDPYVSWSEYRYSITVRQCAPPVVCGARPHVSLARLHAMVDVDVVDDDVTDVLESDATASDDVDVGATAV